MMYETLLFDMNALGDIPDKDFTSRAACAGSIPHERGAEMEGGHLGKHTHWGGRRASTTSGSGAHLSLISHSHQAAGWSPTGLNMRRSESWSPTGILRNCLLEEAFQSGFPGGPDTGS